MLSIPNIFVPLARKHMKLSSQHSFSTQFQKQNKTSAPPLTSTSEIMSLTFQF